MKQRKNLGEMKQSRGRGGDTTKESCNEPSGDRGGKIIAQGKKQNNLKLFF